VAIFVNPRRVDNSISRENTAALLRLAVIGLCAATLAACGGASKSAEPVVVTGTRLAAGDLDVLGTTARHAAAYDWSRGALAVPLAGGDAQVIDAEADRVGVLRDVIITFRNWDVLSAIGDARVWTPERGSQPLADASSGLLGVDDSSTRILVTAGTSDDGTTTNIVVAGTDGSPPVVALAASRAPGCSLSAGYGDGRFVVSACAPGMSTFQISSIDAATGVATPLLTDAKNAFAVLDGAVAVVAANGDGFSIPVGGGAMKPIGHGVDALTATPDRSAVLVRAQGVISRVAADGSSAVTLVPSGAKSIYDVSPDGSTLLFQQHLGPRHSYGDLFSTSALASAAPLTLSTALDTTTFGSAFTQDGLCVLYVTDADDLFVGTLKTRLVSGEGEERTLGHRVWRVSAYADARIVFNSDYVPLPARRGRTVLQTLDTAIDGAKPSVIATHAGAGYALTRARDAIVYSFNDGSSLAGVYLAPLPGASPVETDAGAPRADASDGATVEAPDAGAAPTDDARDAAEISSDLVPDAPAESLPDAADLDEGDDVDAP
jgi:hypothetical protein